MTCRCGRHQVDEEPHLCHGGAYTCERVGTARLVATGPAHVAGAQLKMGAYKTWSYDSCWDVWLELMGHVLR